MKHPFIAMAAILTTLAAASAVTSTPVTTLPHTAGTSPLIAILAIAGMSAGFTAISFSAKMLYRRIS